MSTVSFQSPALQVSFQFSQVKLGQSEAGVTSLDLTNSDGSFNETITADKTLDNTIIPYLANILDSPTGLGSVIDVLNGTTHTLPNGRKVLISLKPIERNDDNEIVSDTYPLSVSVNVYSADSYNTLESVQVFPLLGDQFSRTQLWNSIELFDSEGVEIGDHELEVESIVPQMWNDEYNQEFIVTFVPMVLKDKEILNTDQEEVLKSIPAAQELVMPTIEVVSEDDEEDVLMSVGSQEATYDDVLDKLIFSIPKPSGPTPSGRVYMRLNYNGQSSPVFLGDEAWLWANDHIIFNPTIPVYPQYVMKLADFYTLDAATPNIFDNTLRFTGLTGAAISGYVSGTYYWYDHYFGKLFMYDDSNLPMTTQLSKAASATWQGRSAGDWAVATLDMLQAIADGEQPSTPFANIPIRFANIACSTVYMANTDPTTAEVYNMTNGSGNCMQVTTRPAASNNRVVFVTNI